MELFFLFIFLLSFALTFFITPMLISQGKKAGLLRPDLNKSKRPKVFYIGGIAVVFSLFITTMVVLALQSFFGFSLIGEREALALLLTSLSLSFLGLVDDLLNVPQWAKALLPMIAAVPIISLRSVSSTSFFIPFFGQLDLGIFYLLFFVPFAISGAANLANIFAGVNGLEASLSIIMYLVLSLLGFSLAKPEMAVFSTIMVGSLLAFLYFNKYPARVFPGDVGTLLFGGLVAGLAIVDNLEMILPILFFPHFIDLLIKIKHKLPSKGWEFLEKQGYLYPKKKKVSFLQYIVSFFGKIEEPKLVLFLSLVELLLGAVCLILFLPVKL